MNIISKKSALTLLVCLLISGLFIIPVQAKAFDSPVEKPTPVPCGDGYASDDYGFSYALQQPHWTINWESYVSESTVDEVDVILDELNDDMIAQTMILFKPEDEVGNRVNCAVHFLRYMELGQPSGERKDNGFTFLIVVSDDKIDVHYGVGLGLPALTAQGLTPLNRLAEDTYEETGSMDEALLSLIKAFDEYARSKYEPYQTSSNQSATTQIDPASIATTSGCVITCLTCLALIFILLIIIAFMKFITGGGGSFIRTGRGFRSFPSSRPSSRWSGGSSGRSSIPRMRGGSGSGRSNRGN